MKAEELSVVDTGFPWPRAYVGPANAREVAGVVAAVTEFGVATREREWAHLSLCVLDATFSPNASHTPSLAVCHSYAALAHLDEPMLERATGWERHAPEQRLEEFLAHTESVADREFARRVLGEDQMAVPGGQTLRAEAARRVARVLVEYGLQTLDDARQVVADPRITARIDEALRKIPGSGQREIRASYFWMLVGDADRIKPDRWVLGFLARALGRDVTSDDARALLFGAADSLGRTAWEVDHAIWAHERRI